MTAPVQLPAGGIPTTQPGEPPVPSSDTRTMNPQSSTRDPPTNPGPNPASTSSGVTEIHVDISFLKDHPVASLLERAERELSMLSNMETNVGLLPVSDAHTTLGRIVSVDCYQFLAAMLQYAQRSGSEGAKGYVSVAIASCQGDLGRSISLGNTWFGLFLWPCKSSIPY